MVRPSNLSIDEHVRNYYLAVVERQETAKAAKKKEKKKKRKKKKKEKRKKKVILDIVHRSDGLLGITLLSVSHKAKTTTAARVSILNHHLCESPSETLLWHTTGQQTKPL